VRSRGVRGILAVRSARPTDNASTVNACRPRHSRCRPLPSRHRRLRASATAIRSCTRCHSRCVDLIIRKASTGAPSASVSVGCIGVPTCRTHHSVDKLLHSGAFARARRCLSSVWRRWCPRSDLVIFCVRGGLFDPVNRLRTVSSDGRIGPPNYCPFPSYRRAIRRSIFRVTAKSLSQANTSQPSFPQTYIHTHYTHTGNTHTPHTHHQHTHTHHTPLHHTPPPPNPKNQKKPTQKKNHKQTTTN